MWLLHSRAAAVPGAVLAPAAYQIASEAPSTACAFDLHIASALANGESVDSQLILIPYGIRIRVFCIRNMQESLHA